MKQKRILIYSIASGILGIILISIYVYRVESKLKNNLHDRAKNIKVNVVIALEDIPAETVLRDDMISVKKLSEKSAMPMALSCREEAVGQIAVKDIVKGAQLTAYQINDKRDNLSSKIPGKGLRALSLPVIGVNGLSGLLEPGNRVDIIGTFKENLSGSYSGPTTYTLLQNVHVLAVGSALSKNTISGHYSSVTVVVTPDESEILSLAINSGTVITLSLRTSDDTDILELKKKKFKELFDLKATLNKKRKEHLKSVEVIRRNEKKIEKVR